jgi:DNA-binding transcriptional regulator GbsR (MarR family)
MNTEDDAHPTHKQGCRSGEGQSENQPDGDEEATETAKRVNITISEGQHQTLVDFAEENGMHFSELVRRSCAHFRNQHENDQTARELQPLLHEIREQSEQLESHSTLIEALGDQLDHLSGAVNDDADEASLSDEELAEDLWTLLKKEKELTILEMVNDTEFDRRQVQRGLNKLRDSHVVQTAENDSNETAWVATT